MKSSSEKSVNRGFTLIELLVVIAIIAVLAAAGFQGGAMAMNKARKVSAQAMATSIQIAADQFYTEYSALPDPVATGSSEDKEFNTTSGEGITLLEILAGVDDGDQNSRKMRFLSGKEAKNSKDGIEYGSTGDSIVGMYDPWGQPFYIWLDYGYDERLSFTPKGLSKLYNLNGRRVAVYSQGVADPIDAKPNTLVKSW
jgi:prepilin-type N-terminal cleavage/methylation domain-containing protein